jgi:hypothetical protein
MIMQVPITAVRALAILACSSTLAATPARAEAATPAPSASVVAIELPAAALAFPVALPMPMWWSG